MGKRMKGAAEFEFVFDKATEQTADILVKYIKARLQWIKLNGWKLTGDRLTLTMATEDGYLPNALGYLDSEAYDLGMEPVNLAGRKFKD